MFVGSPDHLVLVTTQVQQVINSQTLNTLFDIIYFIQIWNCKIEIVEQENSFNGVGRKYALKFVYVWLNLFYCVLHYSIGRVAGVW